MLCACCKKNPAKSYIRKVDGKELPLNLCEECYEKLYPEREEQGDFFASFVGEKEGGEMCCPACGTTLEDFRHTGLLGCAYCYTAFRKELLPTVHLAQGKVHHEGKSPSGRADEQYDLIRELVHELDRLKQRIQAAEAEGDEFVANKLKARLTEINRRLYGGEGQS